MIRKIKICWLYIITFYTFLTGCNNRTTTDKKIFRYNEQTNIQSLDPAFAKNQSNMWAVHQIFNTLVEVDDSLHIVPSLAKNWEVSADRKTFTFHLRTSVFFHDNPVFANGKGRLLTAADVVYSLQRILDKNVASPGAWIFNGRVDSITPFAALNDSTFQLKLIRPFQPILGILTMQYCSVVPKEVVEKYGKDFRSHPCGTGPFAFEQWEEGQALTMIRNNRYFETDTAGKPLPYLDGIKVSFFDSKATEFLLFQQKKLHFINDIDASFKDEVLSKKGILRPQWENKIVLQKHPYLNVEYFGILVDESNAFVKNSPLKIKKIRQAINYGIDKNKMMLYLRNSIGIAANSGMVPSGLPSFDTSIVKGYNFNPAMAKQLLKEAGFENGKDLPAIKLSTIPIYADLGTYIAKELEQVGIKVQVDVMQKALLLEKTSKSQALFFRGSWIADYPDAENYLSLFYSKNPAPPNYTRYKNPAFDALYDQAMLETNVTVREKLYQQMDALMIADAPVVPLWYDMVIHLVQPSVKGFNANGLNLLELRRTRVE
jgi:oligopeptide transport system substrate-binding protein